MTKNSKAWCFICCLLLTMTSEARSGTYVCSVVESLSLTDAGELQEGELNSLYINGKFVVDIKTGVMKGDLSNSNCSGTVNLAT